MIEIINQKPLSEIKEEREMQELQSKLDLYELVAHLYEEIEGLRAELETLKGGK